MTSKECKVDFGVFLPVANGGWIVSENAPKLDGSYKQNKEAAIVADEEGLDFVMSMGKWRGFGGKTNHWANSLESVTMMAGIAEATKNVKIWATMHTLIHNPAIVAKMIVTLDQISNGRAGLNIVAGAYKEEFSQMGLWDEKLDHGGRYELADEWTTLVKRLWSEDSVTHDGKFFHFNDCQLFPKPVSDPRPDIICAGQSDRGFRFSVRQADACFISGLSDDEIRDNSRRAKAVAKELGTDIKTYCMHTVIFGDTDEEAEAKLQSYKDGIDEAAVQNMMLSWGIKPDGVTPMKAREKGAFMTQHAVGSPETVARRIEEFVRHCEVDGLMLIFDDYVNGLRTFGQKVLPGLRTALS